MKAPAKRATPRKAGAAPVAEGGAVENLPVPINPGQNRDETTVRNEAIVLDETTVRNETMDLGETIDRGETTVRNETMDLGETIDRGETTVRNETIGLGETMDLGEATNHGETTDPSVRTGEPRKAFPARKILYRKHPRHRQPTTRI
jgi:hypothetical protein